MKKGGALEPAPQRQCKPRSGTGAGQGIEVIDKPPVSWGGEVPSQRSPVQVPSFPDAGNSFRGMGPASSSSVSCPLVLAGGCEWKKPGTWTASTLQSSGPRVPGGCLSVPVEVGYPFPAGAGAGELTVS